MTALRLISLPLHAALEMLIGFVTMAAPFVLGFDPGAAVISVVIGALFVGLALSATAPEGGGRRPLSIAAHHDFDYGLAAGLLGAAVIVGLVGQPAAAAFFAVVALAQLTLNLTTRYSLRG